MPWPFPHHIGLPVNKDFTRPFDRGAVATPRLPACWRRPQDMLR